MCLARVILKMHLHRGKHASPPLSDSGVVYKAWCPPFALDGTVKRPGRAVPSLPSFLLFCTSQLSRAGKERGLGPIPALG